MRIASFNVNNLFSRASALDGPTWQDGKKTLAAFSRLNTLLGNQVYSPQNKKAILELLTQLGLAKSDESEFVLLRQNRGHLLKRPKNAPPEVVANGRGDWIGWLELKTDAVNEVATRMTAKVVQDVNADILAVIEADNRIALVRFNEQLLRPLNAEYTGIMLIDGNDDRGIDVGILLKPGITIESIESHVDDTVNGLRVFSRDCPEYTLQLSPGKQILVMVNHFKSKGYGSIAEADARRKAQAKRVQEIYELRRSQGIEHIAVVGDFNDTPESQPLQPLLADGSELKDIFTHPKFQGDGRPGTWGNGNKSNKIDYILLSPGLFNLVTSAGVWRKGVWGGTKGTLFPHYPEIKEASQEASDHAAVWADLNL